MPHITLDERFPGVVGLVRYRPESGALINALAELMLRGENALSSGERELIAAHVSTVNECGFCSSAHAACAAAQLPGGGEYVGKVLADPAGAEVPPKLAALLAIAGATAVGGHAVTAELVEAARTAGAGDVEIHDTVLIAAMFAMMNRYVDGLGTALPEDPAFYAEGAAAITAYGYAVATSGEVG